MLKYYKHLLKSGYYYEVMAQVVELYQNGFVGRYDLSVGYEDEILCCFSKSGDLIGFIVFKLHDWDGGLFINMGWVAKDHRRKGIYTKQLYPELKAEAERRKCTYIRGGIHNFNTGMRGAARVNKRCHDAMFYTEELEPDLGKEA